jgi:para-nitrobenzyl esterase
MYTRLAEAGPTGPVVRIDSGRISGVAHAGIWSFKGIPYAAPPSGPLRWRAPQPVARWRGVRKSDHVGPLCIQKFDPGDNGVGPAPTSEDCLNLDVYAPAARHKERHPVMVWIHGGGFVNGSGTAALYDGSELAKQGVVSVSINYRLGRLGFFAHPALTRETPSGPLGNYAFMDQIAALQWVKHNIAAFDGDPGNVTIFGESAGGAAVIALMVSPAARGLFHRAISQSGVARGDLPYLNRTNAAGTPSAEDAGKDFMTHLGVAGDDVAALRAVPAEQILRGGDAGSWKDPAPIIDGVILTDTAYAVFNRGEQARVPFLLGSNAWEFPPADDKTDPSADLQLSAEYRARLVSAYGSETVFKGHIRSDTLFTETAWSLARLHSRVAPAYLYRFSVLSQSAPPFLKAAPHASDRQYVFKTLNASPWPTGPMDVKAADLISAYWVQFAGTGDPNGSGRPVWPKYAAASDELVEFSNSGPAVRKTPDAAILEVIASSYPEP